MNAFITLIKKIAAKLLASEIASLKARLSTATTALDRVEQNVTHIPAEAAEEVKALATSILHSVLTASDKVRGTLGTEVHDWEQKLYADYNSSYVKVYAEKLIADTKVFFDKL